MRKIGARVYGMSACAFGLMLFAYSAGFLGNVILPKTIDSGSVVATDAAFAINALLIFLFAVQHSAMARPALRRWLAVRVSPIGAQGIYLFVTGITLSAVFLFWRPIPEVIWSVESPYLKMTLWAVCAMGWSIAILTAATVYHRQWPGMEKAAIFAPDELGRISDFQIPFFYKHVRNPFYLGLIIAFWVTPHMSVGHFMFSAFITAYIVIEIYFEECDLIRQFGHAYLDYRRRVPMLIPRLRRAVDEL